MPTKPISPLVLDSIGVFGLNTQDNASSLDRRWLTKADNVMINSAGRLTSRKGLKQYSNNIGNFAVKSIAEVTKTDSTNELFFAGNNSIYKVDHTTVPATVTAQTFSPTAPTITDDNWMFIQYDDDLLGVQEGHEALHYDSTSGTWSKMSDTATWGAPTGITTFDPSSAVSAYGRSWVGGITEDPNSLFYSQVGEHHNFSASGSGSLNLNSVWGYDVIVGLEIFNNQLIVFGKFNIAIYNGPWDIDVTDGTETFGLSEIIKGVGCVSRDSIKAFGDDILFLSADGVRSLNRTKIQDKMPLTDLTKNVKNDIIKNITASDKKDIKAAYNHAGGYYIISFTGINQHYVLDFRAINPDNTPRVTKWQFTSNHSPKSFLSLYDGTLYVGLGSDNHHGALYTYDGYFDIDHESGSFVNKPYQSNWKSVYMDFGDPSIAKILKKLRFVLDGGRESDISIKWLRDYASTYDEHTKTIVPEAVGDIYLFGASNSLFGQAKYGLLFTPKEYHVNLSKSAKTLQIDMTTTVKGYKGSLQSMTVLAKGGKIR